MTVRRMRVRRRRRSTASASAQSRTPSTKVSVTIAGMVIAGAGTTRDAVAEEFPPMLIRNRGHIRNRELIRNRGHRIFFSSLAGMEEHTE